MSTILDTAERRVWFCLLLTVPVSATPLLDLGSGTLARPLAFVPAVVLLLIAAFRTLVLGHRPKLEADGFLALGLFTAYATLSGLVLVALQPDELFKGQSPTASLTRALITWGIGLAFYIVARLQIRTAADIRTALRLLFAGMAASIGFAFIQVIAMVQGGETLRVVQKITDLLAVRHDGLVSRAQGMTFEPSWLAAQIIVLLMPALIARALSRRECIGVPAGDGFALRLVGGFAVALAGLLFAGSRFGMVCGFAMLLASSVIAARRGRALAAASLLFTMLAGGGGLIVMSGVGAGAGAMYVLGPVSYLTEAANLNASQNVPTNVADTLAMAGRVATAEAAAEMWLDHPLTGVSLGNNYRYFGRYAPDWAFTTQLFTQGAREGVGWLDSHSPEKGNAKNLYLRLLSETGLVGFAILGVFFLRQIFGGPALDPFHRYFRLTTALALGFSFLSQDTFVDAGLWLSIVLCFAMNRVAATPPPNLRNSWNMPETAGV